MSPKTSGASSTSPPVPPVRPVWDRGLRWHPFAFSFLGGASRVAFYGVSLFGDSWCSVIFLVFFLLSEGGGVLVIVVVFLVS